MDFRRTDLEKLQKKLFRFLSAAGIMLFAGCILYAPVFGSLSVKVFYGRYNYDFLGQDVISGILWRIACYAIGFAMTFAVMLLIPVRKTFFSYIGTRTMAIYLFHGLTYSYFKDCTSLLKNVAAMPQALLLLSGCILLTALFSIPQLTAFTNKVADLRLPAAAGQTAGLLLLRGRHWLHEKTVSFTCFLFRQKSRAGSQRMMFLGGRF